MLKQESESLKKGLRKKELEHKVTSLTKELQTVKDTITSLTNELQTVKETITSLNRRTAGFAMSENHAVMTTGDGKIQLLLVPDGNIVLRKYDDLKRGRYHQLRVSSIR